MTKMIQICYKSLFLPGIKNAKGNFGFLSNNLLLRIAILYIIINILKSQNCESLWEKFCNSDFFFYQICDKNVTIVIYIYIYIYELAIAKKVSVLKIIFRIASLCHNCRYKLLNCSKMTRLNYLDFETGACVVLKPIVVYCETFIVIQIYNRLWVTHLGCDALSLTLKLHNSFSDYWVPFFF